MVRTGCRDKAQPVRQRRVVDESVGDHDGLLAFLQFPVTRSFQCLGRDCVQEFDDGRSERVWNSDLPKVNVVKKGDRYKDKDERRWGRDGDDRDDR